MGRTRRLAFSMAFTLAVFALAEGVARLGWSEQDLALNPVLKGFIDHPTRLWAYRPSSTFTPEGGPPWHINSLGLRDEELVRPKPEGVVRVVSLGESTTAGAYVSEEQTYTEVAGARLRAAGWNVDAVNAGVEASTSWQSSILLAELGPVLQPDVVLVYHQLNDFLPTGVVDPHNFLVSVPGSDRELTEQRRPIAPLLGLLHRSRAYLLLRKQLMRLPSDLPDFRAATNAGVRVPEADRREALSRIAATCEELGAQLVVLRPVYRKGRGQPDDMLLRDWAMETGTPFLDLSQARKRSSVREPDFFVDGAHPTVAGHAVFGEAIADYLDGHLVEWGRSKAP